MTNLIANKWNIIEPSVIRDTIAGRLGFQTDFGTTFVSGATQALVLKQNPLDSSDTQGDAFLYVGTTNGGVYMRAYDYSRDTWAPEWVWVSDPSGSSATGYAGNQGIGALAISPDGSMLAVGRGNSTNYASYTPNGPALQIGMISENGTIDWVAVTPQFQSLQAGQNNYGNVRALAWQDDGLYASFYGSTAQGSASQIGLFQISDQGVIDAGALNWLSQSYPLGLTQTGTLAGEAFVVSVSGQLLTLSGNTFSEIASGVSGWDALRTERFQNDEVVARLVVQNDPNQVGGQIALVGWFNQTNKNISYVDRLALNSSGEIVSAQSLDFSGLAGNSQATNLSFFGNYSLAFDEGDPALMTILVGGNQYTSKHPENSVPYASTGGLVSGNFVSGQDSIAAVFGPYGSGAEGNPLIPNSLAIGAPHADSRSILYINTPTGSRLIQSDDGGVWQLTPSQDSLEGVTWTSLNGPG
jgi:hypothetical protein